MVLIIEWAQIEMLMYYICITGFEQEEYTRVPSTNTYRWETIHMQHVSWSFPVSCWLDCTWKNTHRRETLPMWSVRDGIPMSCNSQSAQGMSENNLSKADCGQSKDQLISNNLHYRVISCFILDTVTPQYTSNRFTSFHLCEMHKLIPVFKFTSQFS
jgi:hypothetical protein